MRLQLIDATLIAAGLLLAAAPARGQTPTVRGAMKVNTYVDNDGNQIVTPMTSVAAEAHESVSVHASAGVDVMTCASVDVVSAATPKGYFQETRQEYDGGVTLRFGTLTTDLSAAYSRENDYSSISATLGLSAELFQRNTTITLGYGFTDSNVGRAGDPTFDRDLDSHTVSASVSQVLTRDLIVQAGWFLGFLTGFQSSPYRMVSLRNGTSAPEAVPDERIRQSFVLRARWSPSQNTFLGADYRLYVDTWGIDGHTAQVVFTHTPTPWFEWRVRDRVYVQSAADFYQDTYDQHRQHMSADRELGPFWSNLVGVKLTFTSPALGGGVRLAGDVKFDAGWQWFSEFEELPTRVMFMAEVGARIEF